MKFALFAQEDDIALNATLIAVNKSMTLKPCNELCISLPIIGLELE